MSDQAPPHTASDPRASDASRSGTRRLLLWSSGICGVALALFLISAVLLQIKLIPSPFPSDRREEGLARQRSGESTTAKNNVALPRSSPTGGDGQSASKGAKEIYQGARPLELRSDQRLKIKSWLAQHPASGQAG